MYLGPALLVLAFAAAVALAVACLALVLRFTRQGRELAAAHHLRRLAISGEQSLIRRLRLAAHDIRGVGMTLHGHADHLAAEAHADAAGIAGSAADLLDLADDLQDLTMDSAAPRTLREETMTLGKVVDEAIAAVSATILPGRRNWRVQPDLRPIPLRADRRALRHAISRVLADAVRNTRHDDWIDVSAESYKDGPHEDGPHEDGLALIIADEGKGSLTPEEDATRQDSRGIGLRLALARALIEAHGGRMEVLAAAGVGSRVCLIFPASRLDTALSRPSHSYVAPAPAAGSAGQ